MLTITSIEVELMKITIENTFVRAVFEFAKVPKVKKQLYIDWYGTAPTQVWKSDDYSAAMLGEFVSELETHLVSLRAAIRSISNNQHPHKKREALMKIVGVL